MASVYSDGSFPLLSKEYASQCQDLTRVTDLVKDFLRTVFPSPERGGELFARLGEKFAGQGTLSRADDIPLVDLPQWFVD
jgi:hypothetical protein